MSMFLKKNDLALINGGYLVNKTTKAPVYNEDFVGAQKEAKMLVLLAERVKVANFESVKGDKFEDIVDSLNTELSREEIKVYKEGPEAVKMPTVEKLKKEALSWLNFKEEETKSQNVNRLMQRFNILSDFENFGLFFNEEKIEKLSHIYTIAEILNAIEILEPHLK